MSKFESTELSFKHDPKNPDLGCIRKGASDDIDAEILRQIDKAKHDCAISQGLLPSAAGLLIGTTQDKPVTKIKPFEEPGSQRRSDQSTFITDCGWGRALERIDMETRHQVSETVSKYFSRIDQGFCFGLGKDNEISKEELVDFLVSDESRELTERETADLINVLKNFEKIRDSESDLGSVVNTGITRGDLWSYAHGGELVRKRSSFDVSWSASDLFEALNTK